MLPAPTPDELGVWLRVAGPTTATGALVWTPGQKELSFGWVSFGGPPLLVRLPSGAEVRFSYDGPRRWALDGPDGPLGRSDGRRAVAWRGDQVEAGGELIFVPSPELLLFPAPPAEDPGGEVVADDLLGRACWRWTARDQVRWVDDLTGCLLAHRAPAGTLALTAFEPGAQSHLHQAPSGSVRGHGDRTRPAAAGRDLQWTGSWRSGPGDGSHHSRLLPALPPFLVPSPSRLVPTVAPAPGAETEPLLPALVDPHGVEGALLGRRPSRRRANGSPQG